jgi:hypothetical protein
MSRDTDEEQSPLDMLGAVGQIANLPRQISNLPHGIVTFLTLLTINKRKRPALTVPRGFLPKAARGRMTSITVCPPYSAANRTKWKLY